MSRNTTPEHEPEAESPAERHRSLATLCDRLERLIAGREASRLLDTTGPASGGSPVGIAVLPSWTWTHPRIDVGRKNTAPDGDRLLMPIRLAWSPGPVVLVEPGQQTIARWSTTSLGHHDNGSTIVTVAQQDGSVTDSQVSYADPPAGVAATVRPDPRAWLQRAVEDAEAARWEVLLDLEPHTKRALRQAHANVSQQLSGHDQVRPLLDDTKLESIATRMLFGDDTAPGQVPRVIERCLEPHAFDRVDPLRYISQSLRRDANTEVRRAVGDPHVGQKVRRVAHELGTDDLETVIASYRKRYPADRLSHKRAEAALSVGPDPMAAWWTLHPED